MSSVEFPPVTSFLYMPKIKTEITVLQAVETLEQILETVERRGMAGSFRGGYTGLDVWD
jgi:hypothetical protein